MAQIKEVDGVNKADDALNHILTSLIDFAKR